MPISTVTVTNVYSQPTRRDGCQQHMVCTKQMETFFTLHDLKASLCKRAGELGVPVVIGWRDGRRGTKDITFVELEQ